MSAQPDKPIAEHTAELLPCPFCGDDACCSPSMESGEPEHEDRTPQDWGVGCSCTAFVGPWLTEAEAITAWNTRAGIADPAALRASHDALVEALGRATMRGYSLQQQDITFTFDSADDVSLMREFHEYARAAATAKELSA